MSNTPQRVAQGLYSPLPFQDSIRLFRFKNTFFRTSIALELQVFRLSDHPPYRAVSYTWGSVADQRQILINGSVVVVRKNLWDALEAFKYHRHLRQMKDAFRFKYPIVWFWADILCIRQDSVDEKNHQVSQIDRIFTAATCVWAWLGAHHRIEQYLSRVHEGRFKGSHECPLDEVEYFTRTWTVQECCLARELVLFAGRHVSCKFDSIRNPNYSDINSIAGGIMTLRRKGIRNFPYKSLLICIRMFHLTKCTDPLDKVFALQSMVDPKSRCKVDYSMDAAVLYWQVLMANDDSCDFHQLMTLASALNVTIQDASQILAGSAAQDWVANPSIVLSSPMLTSLGMTREIWQQYQTTHIAYLDSVPFRLVYGSLFEAAKLVRPPRSPLYPDISAYLVMCPTPNKSTTSRYMLFGLLWSTQHTCTRDRARAYFEENYLLLFLLYAAKGLKHKGQWTVEIDERPNINEGICRVKLIVSARLFDEITRGKMVNVSDNWELDTENPFNQTLAKDLLGEIEQEVANSGLSPGGTGDFAPWR